MWAVLEHCQRGRRQPPPRNTLARRGFSKSGSKAHLLKRDLPGAPLPQRTSSALVLNLWLAADPAPFWLGEAALLRGKHSGLLRQKI